MRSAALFLAGLVMRLAVIIAVGYVLRWLSPLYETYIGWNIVEAAVIVVGGVWIVGFIYREIVKTLEPRLGPRAFAVGNTFRFVGIGLVVLAAWLVSGAALEAALFGGAFAGLVIGLALQPTLGNLFAGVLILATKYIEVGDEVRIVTWHLPYQFAFLPGHKFMSPDFIMVGYRGRVAEVSLLYTTLISETGHEIRVPNSVLLDAAVVDYTPRYTRDFVVNVRVEYPLSRIDLDTVEEKVKRALDGFKVLNVYINEQSERDYVIVLVRLAVPVGEDWRRVKSEALKRLLKLPQESVPSQSPQPTY